MANEFVARKGLISLSTSSFYGPVNFSGSSLVGIGTGSVLFTNSSGSVTGSSNLVWDNANSKLRLNSLVDISVANVFTVDQLTFTGRTSTNGISALFVPSGNPSGLSYAFEFRKDSSTFGALLFVGGGSSATSNTANKHVIAVSNEGSRSDRLVMRVAATNGSWANANDHLTVFNTGNIVIQNSAQSATDSGYRLDVNGSGSASGSLRVSGSAYFANNVGIGTATPNSPLHVAGNTYVGSALHVESGIYFNEGGGAFSRRTIWLDVPTNNVYLRLPNNVGNFVFQDWDTASTLFSLSGPGNAYFKRSLRINTTADSGHYLQVNQTGSPSGSLLISGSITQPATASNNLTSVNIIPTMVFTTGSQIQTAFKVMPTFSGSATFTSSQTNIIADFGATSVGSQLIVTDVTSGSIYMVNDVSGIPIIEANSNWDVLMYDYPYTVFKKTGSVVELGALGQASSSVLIKSDLVINEGLGFSYRQSQVSASVAGAVTSSLYNLTFTNVSSSVYIQAVVTGYDTGSRDTITGDIKATIRYRAGAATIVGIDQSFVNTDNSVVGFDIVAGGTSGSLVAFGTGSRTYQFGATVTTQII